VPEIQHAVSSQTSEESRTVNNVRFAIEYWREKKKVFRRIVFEVCILDDDELAPCLGDPVLSAAPFP